MGNLSNLLFLSRKVSSTLLTRVIMTNKGTSIDEKEWMKGH
ncbi:hypothetical protein [Lysinibacillus sp. NPDC056232]